MFEKHRLNFKLINHIESIFNDTGMGFIFVNQTTVYEKSLLNQILCDQFIQKWFSDIYTTSRGQFYSIFKKNFEIENYLTRLPEPFRTSNLRLPIETGRWHNVPKEDRICNLCREQIGDEYHILFVCSNAKVVELRKKYLPNYYIVNPNSVKMEGLLSLCNTTLYKKLSIFIKRIASLL